MSKEPAKLMVRLYANDVLVAESADSRVAAVVMNEIEGPEKQNAEELRRLRAFTAALRKVGW